MRLPAFLFFLLLSAGAYAQTMYAKDSLFHHGLSLRAFGFGIGLEDNLFYNCSVGTEARFLKRHSLGFDYVFSRISYEEDVYVNGQETTSGPNKFDDRSYIHLDYRYYFALTQPEKRVSWFATGFTKLGVRNFTIEKGYPAGAPYSYHESFQQYGGGAGLQVGFGKRGRGGLEVCAGLASHSGRITEDLQPDGSERVSRSVSRGAFYMRTNIYFYLFRF